MLRAMAREKRVPLTLLLTGYEPNLWVALTLVFASVRSGSWTGDEGNVVSRQMRGWIGS